MKTIKERIKNINAECVHKYSHLERWPSYYNRRAVEFLSYLDLMPCKHVDHILELGCGIGYQSSFLSCIADQVTATDLPEENMESHSPGMQSAAQLLEKLQVKNVALKACSAEQLPFANQTFDIVFSSHVMEHIPHLETALKEIERVLKPGGFHFCVVPSRFEKIYAFINYYIYLLKRTFILSASFFLRQLSSTDRQKETATGEKVNRSIKNQLKHFPFPPPHGFASSFSEEFKKWSVNHWRKRLSFPSTMMVTRQQTTQFNPFLPLLGVIWPALGVFLHRLTRKAERAFGRFTIFQWIGINTVIVLRKKPEA